MGAVASIRKKDTGAVYEGLPPPAPGGANCSRLSTDCHGVCDNHCSYALKTIQLGRISREMIEELRNEIDLLMSAASRPAETDISLTPCPPGSTPGDWTTRTSFDRWSYLSGNGRCKRHVDASPRRPFRASPLR